MLRSTAFGTWRRDHDPGWGWGRFARSMVRCWLAAARPERTCMRHKGFGNTMLNFLHEREGEDLIGPATVAPASAGTRRS